MNDLPSILALAGVALTLVVNLLLGMRKSKIEDKSSSDVADKELRDDLLEVINTQEQKFLRQDEKIERQDIKIQKLQETITSLWSENNDIKKERLLVQLRVSELEAENEKLRMKIKELQDILTQFERKVYYRPSEQEK